MSPERFEHLSSLLSGQITRKHHIRQPIPPEERLAVTLRYLATGNTKRSITFEFKMGRSTVSSIIDKVCEVFWDALADSVKPPSTKSDWKRISDGFLQGNL